MLLLFIAPVISTSLAPQRVGGSMMMMHQAMAMDMDMSAGAHPLAAADSAAGSTPHPVLPVMDDSACGYCLLLVHLPLDLFPAPLLRTTWLAAVVTNDALYQPPRARFSPQFFHPRAPPRWRAAI